MSAKDVTHVKPAYVVRGALDYKAAERPQGLCLDSDDDSVFIEMWSSSNWTDVLTIELINDQEELILSKKAYNVLRPFFPASAITRRVSIRGRPGPRQYSSVKLIKGKERNINFPRCSMVLWDFKTGTVGEFLVVSYQDFLYESLWFGLGKHHRFMNRILQLSCDEVAFDELPGDELFRLVSCKLPFYKHEGLVAGEAFREAVIANKLTGFAFEELKYTLRRD